MIISTGEAHQGITKRCGAIWWQNECMQPCCLGKRWNHHAWKHPNHAEMWHLGTVNHDGLGSANSWAQWSRWSFPTSLILCICSTPWNLMKLNPELNLLPTFALSQGDFWCSFDKFLTILLLFPTELAPRRLYFLLDVINAKQIVVWFLLFLFSQWVALPACSTASCLGLVNVFPWFQQLLGTTLSYSSQWNPDLPIKFP